MVFVGLFKFWNILFNRFFYIHFLFYEYLFPFIFHRIQCSGNVWACSVGLSTQFQIDLDEWNVWGNRLVRVHNPLAKCLEMVEMVRAQHTLHTPKRCWLMLDDGNTRICIDTVSIGPLWLLNCKRAHRLLLMFLHSPDYRYTISVADHEGWPDHI